jgi:glycerol-3-phosphate dehydrogenase
VPERKRSVRFRELPVDQQALLIEEDPDYGRIVCRCEIVTRKEILQAIRNPLNVRTINGIKYRCRAMMGRCQGGFCSPRVVEMLAEELEDSLAEVTLKGPGSELFAGTTKGLRG